MQTPIVFIHGTNAGPWTMANFAHFFAGQGYECHSPAYRYHDPSPAPQDAALLRGLSIADYVEDIAAYVEKLAARPILIGHSLGGVIAQKLAMRDLASAIILLNGSVNWGILPTTDHERELAKMFMAAGPFWEETLLPDFETMQRFGLNKLAEEEQRRVFQQLGPESGQVLFELFFWMFDQNETTKIDYDSVMCPILMVSGTDDLAIPPSTARQIAARHGERVTFHEAPGFGHYLTIEPNWREIAELCAALIESSV
ncbi:alpha/beta hydrolase [Blastopirellula sp. JC732]|uniref:Alpha/beta hydrolase n=1 Tax=Blastopirellula sediminis TaxID=2894196 RepID=A0A9X1MIQ6_9BACT|nr:alpha/beta hydrolase [Blastopirellula sediminis]MCC9609395.1 alpha/beta hydrolase [Blastopirellula sediminis]MCC9627828.1 alpha/beta hydrolase [Blastopirellula sediminis]